MTDLWSYATGWQVALPGLAIAVTACLVMVADLVSDDPDRQGLAALGVAGLVVTLGVVWWLWLVGPADRGGYQNVLRADRWALFFTTLICAGTVLTLLMSIDYLRDHPVPRGDYYALVLLAASGMAFMVAANDLVVIFVALEVMSVAVYVLAAILRGDARSSEAGIKYFLLGAFASAFLLYGIAFFYGVTGSTHLDVIARHVSQHGASAYVLLGMTFVLIGFAFKTAVMPFHVWTPDVYEGAPTAVTAFMAGGVKATAFAAFGRVFLVALAPLAGRWSALLWVLAAGTMTVGNVTALGQRSVKRMLAYSSIAHAGYALIALVVGGGEAGAALGMYMATYLVMTMGAFGVVIALERRGLGGEDLRDWAGVGFREPLLGVAMSIFMLSLAGIPPTAGFAGKFFLFSAAVNAGYVGLAVVAILNSLVSAYYYLGVLVQMYMAEGDRPLVPASQRPWLTATIVLAVVGTLVLGVFPSFAIGFAQQAFASLR